MLALPNFSKVIILELYALGLGADMVLVQERGRIAYFIQAFSSTEKHKVISRDTYCMLNNERGQLLMQRKGIQYAVGARYFLNFNYTDRQPWAKLLDEMLATKFSVLLKFFRSLWSWHIN